MKRWKVKLGPDRLPVGVTGEISWAFERRQKNSRYRPPTQYAPGWLYVSAVDELGAFTEAVLWTEKHPLEEEQLDD